MKNNLKGTKELDRIRDLMGKTTVGISSTNHSLLKEVKGPNEKMYGIIKENSGYHIMESNGKGYEYINGLSNKNDYKYNSYAEAMKQLNLKLSSLNEVYDNREGLNLFEAKKYVINAQKQEVIPPPQQEPAQPTTPPAQSAPPTAPAPLQGKTKLPASQVNKPDAVKRPTPMEKPEGPMTPPKPVGPTSTDDVMAPPSDGMDFDAEVASIERELGGGEESPEKQIQSLTGKLGQALRQGEAENLVDTELTKYVVNSVFSALDLAELTDEDKLDIIRKVKNAGTGEEQPGTPDIPMGGMPPEEEDSEMEIDGLDTGMDSDLDIDLEDFEDEMTEDMLYGDGEETGDEGLAKSLKSFVQKTVDSYIDNRGV